MFNKRIEHHAELLGIGLVGLYYCYLAYHVVLYHLNGGF